MSCLVDSSEREVAVLSHLTSNIRVIHNNISIPGVSERGCVGVRDSQRQQLASIPIAGVVSVTIDQGDFNAFFEEIRQIFLPTRARIIANAAKPQS
jgi:hypothetical protein